MTRTFKARTIWPILLILSILACASRGRSPAPALSDALAESAILGTWVCTEGMMLEESTLYGDGTETSVTRMFGPAGEFEITVKATWRIEDGSLIGEITESSFPEILAVGDTHEYRIVSLSERKLVLTAEDGDQVPHYRKLEPAHQRLVERYLESSGTRVGLEQAWKSIRKAQMEQVKSMRLPEDKQEVATEIMGRLQDYLGQAIAYEKVKHYYVYLYADLFSKEELKELIRFYESHAGRKMVAVMPEAMDRSMKDMMKKMQMLSPALDQIVQDTLNEMGEREEDPEGT